MTCCDRRMKRLFDGFVGQTRIIFRNRSKVIFLPGL